MHSAVRPVLAIDQKDEADNLKRWRQAWRCRVLAVGAEKGLRRQGGGRHAQCGDERAGSRRAERRPLADGRSAAATIAAVQDFLENRKEPTAMSNEKVLCLIERKFNRRTRRVD